jgi:hypothetical protein
MGPVEKRLQTFKRIKIEHEIIKAMRRTGYNRSEIEVIPDAFADRKPEEGQVYYYYNGPLDHKTRPFCRLMLKIDKVFSKEQIEYMSAELGYPVLEYAGSFGCRHHWVKFIGKVISTPNPTQREIRKLINSGI